MLFIGPSHFLVVTTRLSTVGQDEGGPSWSSLHVEPPPDSPPEDKALLVQIKVSMMVETIEDLLLKMIITEEDKTRWADLAG